MLMKSYASKFVYDLKNLKMLGAQETMISEKTMQLHAIQQQQQHEDNNQTILQNFIGEIVNSLTFSGIYFQVVGQAVGGMS